MMYAIRYRLGAAATLLASLIVTQTSNGDTSYFPLRKDAEWTYKFGVNEIKVKVVKVDKVGGEDQWQVDTIVGKDPKTTEWYAIRADGVYRTKVQSDKLEPAIKVFPLPLIKDATWEVDSKMGGQTIKGKFKVKNDKEKIKLATTNAEYETVLIEGENLDIAGTKATIRIWFAKDIGIVRQEFVLQNNDRSVIEMIAGPPPPK